MTDNLELARLPLLTRPELQALMAVVNATSAPVLAAFRTWADGELAAPQTDSVFTQPAPPLAFEELDGLYRPLDQACLTMGVSDQRWGMLNSLRTAVGEARDGLLPFLGRSGGAVGGEVGEDGVGQRLGVTEVFDHP